MHEWNKHYMYRYALHVRTSWNSFHVKYQHVDDRNQNNIRKSGNRTQDTFILTRQSMTVLPNTADPSCHTVIHPWAKEQHISGICPYPPSLEKHFKLNKIMATFQDVPNRKTPKMTKAYENCQVKLKILIALFGHASIRNIKTLDLKLSQHQNAAHILFSW